MFRGVYPEPCRRVQRDICECDHIATQSRRRAALLGCEDLAPEVAGYRMLFPVITGELQSWTFLAATLLSVGTARMITTTRRRIEQARNIAGSKTRRCIELVTGRPVRAQHRSDESSSIWMQRTLEELCRRCGFDELAEVHDRHPIA